MGWLILMVLLVIVGVGLFLGGKATKATANDPSRSRGGYVAWGGLIACMVLATLAFFAATTHQVENGHIGIVKQFGSLVGTTAEGLVFTAPWQSLSEVSVQNEKRDYDMTQANSAVSSDSQAVFLIVQVNYKLERDKAVDLYRETGGHHIDRILDPAVFQNTKAVTANYKAIDFAKNREQIRQQIEKAIQSEVEPHGISIQNVSLKNVDFTDALSKAIEETVEAEQQAKRAQAQVEIKKAEADQAIAEARGAATAQRLRQRTLTPLLIEQQRIEVSRLAVEKLGPNTQVIYLPGSANLFLPATGK